MHRTGNPRAGSRPRPAPAASLRGAGDPYADQMNAIPKYVVSNTLTRADWNNTTILSGDVAAQVAQLLARGFHVHPVVRTRAAIEAINRIEATGAHVLGATLTKSIDSGGGYGSRRYGYGYGYGKLDKKRTEILMIPQGTDS